MGKKYYLFSHQLNPRTVYRAMRILFYYLGCTLFNKLL